MEYLILKAEEKSLIVAHFAFSRRSSELVGAASMLLDDDQALAEAVSSIAEKVTGSMRVVLCLPPTLFAHRNVTLPFNDMRKIREVLPGHLQGDIALPLDELSLDVLSTGEGQFLALWARKNDIASAIAKFREFGIEPHIISSLPFALAYMPGIPPDCAVSDGTTLALLKGGRLIYFRASDFPMSSSLIASTLATLEITGGELPSRLCLIGSEGNKFRDTEVFPLPVETLTLPSELGNLFKNEETFQQIGGLFAVAKACHAGILPDFRRGDLAWTAGNTKLQRKLLFTVVLAIAVVILLFVSKALQYRAAVADLSSVNKSISAIYREIFPNRAKAVDEISEVKGEIRKLAGIDNTSGFLDVLKKLAEAKGNSINGLYDAELEGRNLRIKGDARSAQSVNEFKTLLDPFLISSQLGEVKSRPDGTVAFSLTGMLKEGAK